MKAWRDISCCKMAHLLKHFLCQIYPWLHFHRKKYWIRRIILALTDGKFKRRCVSYLSKVYFWWLKKPDELKSTKKLVLILYQFQFQFFFSSLCWFCQKLKRLRQEMFCNNSLQRRGRNETIQTKNPLSSTKRSKELNPKEFEMRACR